MKLRLDSPDIWCRKMFLVGAAIRGDKHSWTLILVGCGMFQGISSLGDSRFPPALRPMEKKREVVSSLVVEGSQYHPGKQGWL